MADVNQIVNSLNIGKAKQVIESQTKSPLATLLQSLANEVVQMLASRLTEYDAVASNNLVQSIQLDKLELKGSTLSLGIKSDFYWKFVNFGVNGIERSHGAPAWGSQPKQELSFHQSIKEWIRNKGIVAPEQFNNNYDSFAWAIVRNKIKYGQEARPFLTDVVNDNLVDYLREQIQTLLGRSIEILITEPQWQ